MNLIRWCWLGGAVSVIACSSTRSVETPDYMGLPCAAVGLSVMPASATAHIVDTLRVTATPLRGCSGIAGSTFRWRSNDTSIATVDSLSGLLRARATGNVAIVARAVEDTTIAGAMILKVIP
jgi:uncharacterized protein YjdB